MFDFMQHNALMQHDMRFYAFFLKAFIFKITKYELCYVFTIYIFMI